MLTWLSISAGVILTSLESSQHHFQIPDLLQIPQTITCRVSSFGSEIFDRSTRTSLRDNESVFTDIPHSTVMEQPVFIRQPLPPSPSILSQFPLEILVKSPPIVKKAAKGWGEERTHLVEDTSTNSTARTTSSGSISGSSSYTSISDRSSDTPVSKRIPRPRNVTPSSSISHMSRRSPLSTMRYRSMFQTFFPVLTDLDPSSFQTFPFQLRCDTSRRSSLHHTN